MAPVVCPHCRASMTIRLKGANHYEVLGLSTVGTEVICPQCSHRFEIPLAQAHRLRTCEKCEQLIIPIRLLKITCSTCSAQYHALGSWMAVRCPRCGEIGVVFDTASQPSPEEIVERKQGAKNFPEFTHTGLPLDKYAKFWQGIGVSCGCLIWLCALSVLTAVVLWVLNRFIGRH
jgi:DNA-directed RNA polymerase subunit RPC12/RpoP